MKSSRSNDGGEVVGKGYAVDIRWRSIEYTEADLSLTLGHEFTVDGKDYVYVPTETRWVLEMPSWAHGRRHEILSRIRHECRHLEQVWEEY